MEKQNFFPEGEKEQSFLQRNSKTLKIITIGILVMLSFIPMFMIRGVIDERHLSERGAIREVSEKWSSAQTVMGPYLHITYVATRTIMNNNKETFVEETKNLILLPEELNINAKLTTELRKRGIYEVNVYNSELTQKGSFNTAELKNLGVELSKVRIENATICLGITDMRGIGEQIHITVGDSVYDFDPGLGGKGLSKSGVSKTIDTRRLNDEIIPFDMKLKLKGSQSMHFAPLGKTTQVTMQANWGTPSFDGKFLPEKHEITDNLFAAQWKVLNLNRSFGQAFFDNSVANEVKEAEFGVKFIVPVDQYQQSTRAAKYAVLIILLTFTVIFFVEIFDKKRIHLLQYLLIGLALCLFYSLLVSLSEHIGFGWAYIIASVLTVSLISLYMRGIMKSWRPAGIMAGLLTALYTYIYVLIQLETMALLAGSLGLFVILATIMYFSKKIDWFKG